MVLKSILVVVLLLVVSCCFGWHQAPPSSRLVSTIHEASSDYTQQQEISNRRELLRYMTYVLGGVLLAPSPTAALVKGVAPPPRKSASDKPKCTNVEECQALAEKREQELREKEEQGPPPMVTSGGVRYRDLEDGEGTEIKDGDDVEVFYKVLKLGKRSYDGLSGEGTVVFSRGKLHKYQWLLLKSSKVFSRYYVFLLAIARLRTGGRRRQAGSAQLQDRSRRLFQYRRVKSGSYRNESWRIKALRNHTPTRMGEAHCCMRWGPRRQGFRRRAEN